MPSERVQRQIDRLLDEAEQAIAARDWALVEARCEAVQRLDPANEDARTYLAAARHDSPGSRATPSPPAVPALPAAFVNGRFQVQSLLGEGARKVVYRAHDTRLNRDVAFALIKSDGLAADDRERLVREARALGQLSEHPNIVTVFEVGEDSGRPYLVTELLRGGDLVQALQQAPDRRLPLERILSIGAGVASALAFAHGKGVIHRDVKPANVWLTADGTPKLGDFGLASAGEQVRLTQAGMLIGTVAYLPPEQAMGAEPSPQADLYALGCLLYELLCGRPPFLSDDPATLVAQHLNATPVAPSWLSDRCPTALESLVLQLLAKRPAERPGSANEVVAALSRIDPAQRSVSHSEPGTNPLERLAQGAFVGREQELARLRQACELAFAGQGGVVMLVGEPGIGKTRIAQALESYALLRGAQVLWGASHDASGAPAYWPWMQIGRAWAAPIDPAHLLSLLGSSAGELTRLFPDLARVQGVPVPQPTSDPEAAQFALFDAYVQFLRGAAARRPLLLVLDDLHWADKPSLQLLQHLARELGRMPLLVVGTYRDTDIVRTQPLAETLAALNRETGFTRIVLRGLSREEVAAYIRATAGVEPGAALTSTLFEETEGNPFFLSEVVNLLTQEGTLQAERVGDMRVPDGVREALGRRLDRLSSDATAVLQVAAIVGREFTYDTLTLLGDQDEDQLLAQIEAGVAARVIEELPKAGRYRFSHALMQETLLGELSTTRKVRMHGQVGEALERRWGARAEERASRLALHFGEAATLSVRHAAKEVRYGQLAAQQAEASTAWSEAARHYERVLALVSDADDRLGADEAALLLALGRCAASGGEPRAGWRALMRAIDLYRQRGDGRGLATATLVALAIPAPPARHAALVEQARAAVGADAPELEAQLLVRRLGPALAEDDDSEQAQARRQRLEILLAAHDLPEARAQLTQVDATAAIRAQQYAQGASLSLDAFQQFDRVGAIREASQALESHAIAQSNLGKLDAASAGWERWLAYTRRHHLAVATGRAAGYLASLLLGRGELAACDALLADPAATSATAWPAMVRRALTAGDTAGAVAQLPDPAVMGGVPAFEVSFYAAAAYTRAAAGDCRGAQAAFARLRSTLPQVPFAVVVDGVALFENLVGMMDDAVLELADADFLAAWERLLTERVRSSSPLVFFPYAGSAQRLLAAILLARGRVEAARAEYEGALAWCEQERCPVEKGRCLVGLATIAAQAGDGGGARSYLTQAAELFHSYEAGFYLQQVEMELAKPDGGPAERSSGTEMEIAGRAPATAEGKPVFISYASADREHALVIADALEAGGHSVWIDRRNIGGGRGWSTEIVRGIKGCGVFIVLGSASAFASPNVQRELNLAVEENRPLLPLLLAAVQPPDEVRYALAGRQWVELQDRPQADWLPNVLRAIAQLTSAG